MFRLLVVTNGSRCFCFVVALVTIIHDFFVFRAHVVMKAFIRFHCAIALVKITNHTFVFRFALMKHLLKTLEI